MTKLIEFEKNKNANYVHSQKCILIKICHKSQMLYEVCEKQNSNFKWHG